MMSIPRRCAVMLLFSSGRATAEQMNDVVVSKRAHVFFGCTLLPRANESPGLSVDNVPRWAKIPPAVSLGAWGLAAELELRAVNFALANAISAACLRTS